MWAEKLGYFVLALPFTPSDVLEGSGNYFWY